MEKGKEYEMTEQGYYIEEEVFEKLRRISDRLHSGSDAMRDEGHKLWLVLKDAPKIELCAFGSETSWDWVREERSK
jgi:hypothetical protein